MIHHSDIKPNGFVDLWDTGPLRPVPPEQPPAPPKPSNPKTADDVLAALEHADLIAKYEADLRQYGRLKKEFDHWQAEIGGPRKVEMWPVNAREVLEAQAAGRHTHERYVKHLPLGMKPGKAQIAADAREQAEADYRQRAINSDPHFGTDPDTNPAAVQVHR